MGQQFILLLIPTLLVYTFEFPANARTEVNGVPVEITPEQAKMMKEQQEAFDRLRRAQVEEYGGMGDSSVELTEKQKRLIERKTDGKITVGREKRSKKESLGWAPEPYLKWGMMYEECSDVPELPKPEEIEKLINKFHSDLELQIQEKGEADVSVAETVYKYAGQLAVVKVDIVAQLKVALKKHPQLNLRKPFHDEKENAKSFLCLFPERLESDLKNILKFDQFDDEDKDAKEDDNQCKIQNYGKLSQEYFDMMKNVITGFKLEASISCGDKIFSEALLDIIGSYKNYISVGQASLIRKFVKEISNPSPLCGNDIDKGFPFRSDTLGEYISLPRLAVRRCGKCSSPDRSFDKFVEQIKMKGRSDTTYTDFPQVLTDWDDDSKKCFYKAILTPTYKPIDQNRPTKKSMPAAGKR